MPPRTEAGMAYRERPERERRGGGKDAKEEGTYDENGGKLADDTHEEHEHGAGVTGLPGRVAGERNDSNVLREGREGRDGCEAGDACEEGVGEESTL